jgi:hypothetical protein
MRSSCASRPSPAGNMLVKAPLRRHPGRQPRPERVPHRLGELGDPEVQELQLSIVARAHRGGEAASRLRRLAARVPQESSRGVGLRHGVQLGQGPAPRPGVAGPAALDFRKLVVRRSRSSSAARSGSKRLRGGTQPADRSVRCSSGWVVRGILVPLGPRGEGSPAFAGASPKGGYAGGCGWAFQLSARVVCTRSEFLDS